MKKLTRIAFVALCSCFILASCSKEDVLPVSPVNDAVNPKLDQIADFKVIMPKGNQVIADGVDQVQYEILFYDGNGNVINDKLPVLTDVIGKVEVEGQKMYLPAAMKASKVGAYNVIITAGKITKSIPMIATTADKKVVEIPIIFNFVSTDYSDKVVEKTISLLNSQYLGFGVDNVVFKLAEIDNEGKPLARKGVKFWNYNEVATDQMDYKKLWGKTKYAVNIYQIKNVIQLRPGRTPGISAAYADPANDVIVIDNAYDNLDKNIFGFWAVYHEMGHILGLADVYDKYDGNCKVQEGVSDIEGFNQKTVKINTVKNTYISNCGNEYSYDNLMAVGYASNRTLSPDQVKVAKKAALSVSF